MSSLIKQARDKEIRRRRPPVVDPRDRNVRTTEPTIVEVSTLLRLAEEVFSDQLVADVPDSYRRSEPKLILIPLKSVITHITESIWRRMCLAHVEQYLREVSNRERYGRWVLHSWEFERQNRIHPRNVSFGADRSFASGLQPGQTAAGQQRHVSWNENLGYLIVAIQAVDTVNAEATVWKRSAISDETDVGGQIARALRDAGGGAAVVEAEHRAQAAEDALNAALAESEKLRRENAALTSSLTANSEILSANSALLKRLAPLLESGQLDSLLSDPPARDAQKVAETVPDAPAPPAPEAAPKPEAPPAPDSRLPDSPIPEPATLTEMQMNFTELSASEARRFALDIEDVSEARAMLEAENTVRGTKARKTVIAALEKVIADGEARAKQNTAGKGAASAALAKLTEE